MHIDPQTAIAKRLRGVTPLPGGIDCADLSVHCDTSDEIKLAKGIMKNTGGEDISSTGESSVDSANREDARGTAPSRR